MLTNCLMSAVYIRWRLRYIRGVKLVMFYNGLSLPHFAVLAGNRLIDVCPLRMCGQGNEFDWIILYRGVLRIRAAHRFSRLRCAIHIVY